MKTIPVSIAALAFLMPGLAFAEPAARKGPETERQGYGQRLGGPAGRDGRDGWEKADTDGDGLISREEFDAMPRIQSLPEENRDRLFARLDKSGDGFINLEELGRKGRGRGEAPRPIQRLEDLDTDNSGGISFEEFQAGELFKKLPRERQLAMFRRLDTDGDGEITPRDRPQPPRRDESGRGSGLRPLLRLLDADGDEAITFEEYRNAPFLEGLGEEERRARFDQLDRNKDGKIDAADFPPPRQGREDGPRGEAKEESPAGAE